MKKFYTLICLGLVIAIAATAQPSGGKYQTLHKNTARVSAPDKPEISAVIQPLPMTASRFLFDSLNVSYEGSWGFGQSFSMGTNEAGNIKFVGSGAGVIILDVSNPASPVKISELSTRGLVDAIFFDETNNRLYVTAYFAGFEIWDVSNMEAPQRIGAAPVEGLPRGGIYADNNFVYVVSVADGVQIYDITIPSAPLYVTTCAIDPNALCWTSAKAGDYIYCALSDGGMAIVDVTVPEFPAVAGTYPDIVYGVDAANGFAYVVSYSYGLNILDISNPQNITVVGTCALPGFPYRVQIVGNYAFVGNNDYSGAGGVNVVDISNPASPTLVATWAGFAEHIAAAGNTLALTGSGMACTILDISTPTAPVLATTYSLPNFVSDIYVEGNYAYTGNNGFRVFDISDKSNPVQVGYNVIDGSIVRTAGDVALYIRESMSANNPVMVMDISDPANPTLLGQYMAPNMTSDLQVKDNYAFVACWWDGVRIVDFQDHANPVLVKKVMGWTSGGIPGETFFYAQALEVEGNYLYVLDYGPFEGEDTRGLYILDITDVANPVVIKRYKDFQSYGYDLDVVGNMVYIADNYGGLEVIDVTDKVNPVTRGWVGLPDGANFVKVTENMAFVADYIAGGVQVVDVTNPDNPTIAGYYAPSGCFAIAVDVEGTNIYLADGAGGFQIYNTTLITSTNNLPKSPASASTSWPNPFSENLMISINSASSQDNTLNIYNSAGTRIATLQPVRKSPTEILYEWNGKTSAGTPVTPGFYYYKVNGISGKVAKI